MPTKHISVKKIITETYGGIPSHTAVWPLNKASRITAKLYPSIKKDIKARPQKKKFCKVERAGYKINEFQHNSVSFRFNIMNNI